MSNNYFRVLKNGNYPHKELYGIRFKNFWTHGVLTAHPYNLKSNPIKRYLPTVNAGKSSEVVSLHLSLPLGFSYVFISFYWFFGTFE